MNDIAETKSNLPGSIAPHPEAETSETEIPRKFLQHMAKLSMAMAQDATGAFKRMIHGSGQEDGDDETLMNGTLEVVMSERWNRFMYGSDNISEERNV